MVVPKIPDSVLRTILNRETITLRKRTTSEDEDGWGDVEETWTDYSIKGYLHTLTYTDILDSIGGQFDVGDAKLYLESTIRTTSGVAVTNNIVVGDRVKSDSDEWEVIKVNTWKDKGVVFREAYCKRRST